VDGKDFVQEDIKLQGEEGTFDWIWATKHKGRNNILENYELSSNKEYAGDTVTIMQVSMFSLQVWNVRLL
jgi:hypothetical protein